MYLQQSDIVNLQLKNNFNMNMSDTLKDIIESDLKSPEKKNMKDGGLYYQNKPEITNVNFQKILIDNAALENKNLANNKLINAFFKVLVDQKVSYIAGNPIAFKNDDKDVIKGVLGYRCDKIFRSWIKGASYKGVEYLHPYINSQGGFDYVLTPAEQIIPVYDTQYQRDLVTVIRYYPVTLKKTKFSTPVTIFKVEVWTKDKVFYVIQDETGKYIPDPSYAVNPQPHFYEYNTSDNVKEGRSWGQVPFIPLLNNDESSSDLTLIKSLVDAYDYNLSKFTNDLADIAQAIWVLKGYGGTSLSEFMRNLYSYKSINLAAKPEADVRAERNEVPYMGYKELLDRMEDNIFVFGMGVNPKTDKFGNSPTGVALKFMYAGLDLKSNMLITEMKSALMDVMNFINTYNTVRGEQVIDMSKVEPVFNKSILINESEAITNVALSKGLVDEETALSHHPWVNDVQEVIKRKKLETENSVIFDNITDEE